jgi:hypothetical protein
MEGLRKKLNCFYSHSHKEPDKEDHESLILGYKIVESHSNPNSKTRRPHLVTIYKHTCVHTHTHTHTHTQAHT